MTIATKTKSSGIKVSSKATFKVSKTPTEFRKSEADRRTDEKCQLLDKYSTSEDLFDRLVEEIRTLSNDESSSDLSVDDEYNYGVDYEVDLLLEVIRDLRWFTRYNKVDDDNSITESNLTYIRQYWN